MHSYYGDSIIMYTMYILLDKLLHQSHDQLAVLYILCILSPVAVALLHLDSGMDDFNNHTFINVTDCVDGYINRTPEYVKIVTAFTCLVSMLGSSSIVFSYVCYKQLRSKAREILVHLSLMNFVASFSMLVGITLNFSSNFNFNLHVAADGTYETYKRLCVSQAAFLMYSSQASLLWTVSISIYCYFLVMFEDYKLAERSVYGYYTVCYGLPLITTVWFVATDKLSYSANRGSGWCSLSVHGSTTKEFTLLFGYDIWAYIAIGLLPIIAISLIIHQRLKVRLANITENRTVS